MADRIRLAIGMTAVARTDITLRTSVGMLRYGFPEDDIHVFAEPDTPIECLFGVHVHCNWSRLGVCGNWVHCLNWLLRQTSADHLLVVENDVRFCSGAGRLLVEHLERIGKYGFCSLYTRCGSEDASVPPRYGWVKYDGNWMWRGAQALCLHRAGAEDFLRDERLHDVTRDPELRNGRGGIDNLVGEFYRRYPYPSYYHVPSLTDHIGVRSSRAGHQVDSSHRGLNFKLQFGRMGAGSPVVRSVGNLPEAGAEVEA